MSCKIPVHEPPTKSPILKNKVIGTEIEKTRAKMVPQTLNMVDGILRPVRIFKVQKNCDLCDKYGENISLQCEYDPQGITLKCFTGKTNRTMANHIFSFLHFLLVEVYIYMCVEHVERARGS